MVENYKFKVSASSIIILSIIILTIDYFVMNEFKIESGFLVGIIGLLAVCLLSMIRIIQFNRYLTMFINFIIVTVGSYTISILFVLLFGYGFTGREVPSIWIIGFITNAGLLIFVVLDLIDKLRIKEAGK